MEAVSIEPRPINRRVVSALFDLLGVTQQEAAEWLGVNPAQMTRRLQGQTKWSAVDIRILADRLDVPTDTFYMSSDEALSLFRSPRSPGGGSTTAVTHRYVREANVVPLFGRQLELAWHDDTPELPFEHGGTEAA